MEIDFFLSPHWYALYKEHHYTQLAHSHVKLAVSAELLKANNVNQVHFTKKELFDFLNFRC